MSNFNEDKQEEVLYLEKTVAFIKEELRKEESSLKVVQSNFINSGREMWEEAVHFSEDVDRIPELTQHLSEVNNQNRNYNNAVKRLDKLRAMLKSPYFGRFDFKEEGYDELENIYIGIHNLMDTGNDTILVYDWRAPISSIFYREELGKASYKSPVGLIDGEVTLKRQYKIQDSELKYFFDSSIRINDEILQEVLSHNSSNKMKSIVETIQKEQDIIIRDTENDLLIVQGVAGSGKTSIALHRIAFLLYEGLNSKLNVNNIIIISPNTIFSRYISEVLPELGEENVGQITFDDIISKFLGANLLIEKRNMQLEALVSRSNLEDNNLKSGAIEFKGSGCFKEILDRFIDYYERVLIEFKDIYFDGKIIKTRHELKNQFLNNKIGMSAAKRLKRIENMILDKVHPLRKARVSKIEKIVQKSPGHEFEIKSFSRLLSIKEAKVFMEQLRSFTKVDYMKLYRLLFEKKDLLIKLSKGLEMPNNIHSIINDTAKKLGEGYISYEDCWGLLYLKLKLEGMEEFSEIRQVVIDEAQDYYPLQYEIFKLLFKNTRFTVLGDFNQTIEKKGDKSLYNEVEGILFKRKSVKLFLNKSYRSSYEITAFAQRFLDYKQELAAFDRHEEEPVITYKENKISMEKAISEEIKNYKKQGYESIAVICKTQIEAEEIQERLSTMINIKLLNSEDIEIKKGALVIPAYMSKGLEFDAVIVYDASEENYKSEFDKRLLYIACTRALHRLAIYYTGNKSVLI